MLFVILRILTARLCGDFNALCGVSGDRSLVGELRNRAFGDPQIDFDGNCYPQLTEKGAYI